MHKRLTMDVAVDFTREPIIETIITPKEGCKLVVRSSKNAGQEEYFVDAVEVVSFGQASFFRSLERPKPFLVPIADYEILEVREARMVLKSVGIDRSIKIGGGREAVSRMVKGEKEPVEAATKSESSTGAEASAEAKTEGRPGLEKKRDRRRQYRKRRGAQAVDKEEQPVSEEQSAVELSEEEKVFYPVPEEQIETGMPAPGGFSSLLQPPPTLISETINRYRENALFKSAFFLTEEEQYKPHDKVQELLNEDEEDYTPPLQEPVFAESEGMPEAPVESEGIAEVFDVPGIEAEGQTEATAVIEEGMPLERPFEEEKPMEPVITEEPAALPLFEEEYDEKFGEENKE